MYEDANLVGSQYFLTKQLLPTRVEPNVRILIRIGSFGGFDLSELDIGILISILVLLLSDLQQQLQMF